MPQTPTPYPSSDDRIGVLIERVDALRDDLREHRHETRDHLTDIGRKVDVTNGRVRDLELWREGIRAVRAALSWRVPLIVGVASSVISGVTVGVVLLVIGAGT